MGQGEVMIREVVSSSERKRFVDFAWEHYQDSANWIPPLRYEIMQRVGKKNRFLKKGNARLFMAFRDGKLVGRIGASIDDHHNNYHKEKLGFFGFYECIDDMEVSQKLMDTATEWLKSRGMTKMRGPFNYIMEDPQPGFLAQGHDKKPYLNMAWTHPYYLKHMEYHGMSIAKDLVTWEISTEGGFPENIVQKGKEALAQPELKIRPLKMRKLKEEVLLIVDIFNDALAKNWGFVPFTRNQAMAMARDLKPVVDPRVVLIAEWEGKPVGVVINIPNFNEVIEKCNGRLFPFGIFKLLYYRRRLSTLRPYALGVRSEFRNKGLGVALIMETVRRGPEIGYHTAEISWVLDDNQNMNDMAKFLGSSEGKIYRVYERDI